MAIRKGVIPKSREILAIRSLVRDDLEVLREPRAKNTVAKLRDPHHRVARLIASGLRRGEVVARSGYSYQRVFLLEADPSFQELVAQYRKEVTQAWLDGVDDFYELATSNMLKAERQIAEKLEEADEKGELLPTRDLIAISRDAADRFGYGKKSTNLNVNVDFAAKLEQAIKRSGKVIESAAVLPSRVPQQPVAALAPSPPMEQPQPFRRRA